MQRLISSVSWDCIPIDTAPASRNLPPFVSHAQRLMGLHSARHGTWIHQFTILCVMHEIQLHHLSRRRAEKTRPIAISFGTHSIVITFFARLASRSPLWTTSSTASDPYCVQLELMMRMKNSLRVCSSMNHCRRVCSQLKAVICHVICHVCLIHTSFSASVEVQLHSLVCAYVSLG